MTEINQFTPGDEVFTANGQKVVYVAESAGFFVVNPVYHRQGWDEECDDEDDTFISGVITVDAIFRTAPVEVFDGRILELDAKVKLLRERITALQTEQQWREADRKALITKISQNEALHDLEAFIEGKIEWFTTNQCGRIAVHSKDELLQVKSDYAYRVTNERKLLSLFGGANGDLLWKINDYKDGSGSWTEVYPFITRESAVEKAATLIADVFARWNDDKKKDGYLESAAYAAEKLGLEVPEEVSSHLKAQTVRIAKGAADKAKQEYEEKLARLQALETGVTKQ